MNQLLLTRQLGLFSPQFFQRVQYERLLYNVAPEQSIKFDAFHSNSSCQPSSGSPTSLGPTLKIAASPGQNAVSHNGGVNVLTADEYTGRYLVSGGADSAIRLWDLEETGFDESYLYHPIASVTRSTSGSHRHALTSVSIYPFDPVPSTILTSSYDKTLKLFSIDASRIAPVHSFEVIDTPYSHSVSSASLVAVGTAHPAVKMLDLRTGLATHTLPGHSGAVFSVRWCPRSEHLLASGSTDGRVLFFDVRRAHSAFACLDLDDAIGVLSPEYTSDYQPRSALDWNAKAHNGPVTGVRWVNGGSKIVTCGHDQRIRVWDAATGRNELIHFGPRIKNERNGEFAPLIAPTECGRPGKGALFWANDNVKGEIFVMDMNEGAMQKVLQTPGTSRNAQKGANLGSLNSGGRVNSMACRYRSECGSGLELYSGHGDGTICCWKGSPPEDEELEDKTDPELEAAHKRKRKRDLLDGIVDGLVKRPGAFT